MSDQFSRSKKDKLIPIMKECGNCAIQEDSIRSKLKRCGRCQMVWYCGKECQVQHWKNGHQNLCIPLEDRKPSLEKNNLVRDGTKIHCAICLDPVSSQSDCVLSCSHIFHVKCLSNLRAAAETRQVVCPLCRSDLPPGPEDCYNKGYSLWVELSTEWDDIETLSLIQKQSVDKMVSLLISAANEEHERALRTLFMIYFSGHHDVIDYQKALEWCKKAAELDHAWAQHNLGVMLQNSEGYFKGGKDSKKGFPWYQKAAEQGYPCAQYTLGALFETGEAGIQSMKQAEVWYRKAAQGGDVDAQSLLGCMLEHGRGVKSDMNEAMAYYRQAALQDHDIAQNNLATLLARSGHYDEAAMWFRRAAEQGVMIAQCSMGIILKKGEGVKKNVEEAKFWYRKAANQGDCQAQFKLGCLLYNTRMEKDKMETTLWFRKAAEQGHSTAQYYLGIMLQLGHGVERNHKQAQYWFKKSDSNLKTPN